jgi:UDP-2-acetamido-2,6-beta-L-arabino-hexul-4-ose reductase
MKNIIITGQSGFIGTHLYNYIKQNCIDYNVIDFHDAVFENMDELKSYVSKADAVVHFAALNRHNDPNEIYNTNVDLVKKLIAACLETNSKPHIIFSSSTQEERDNPYGKSKKEGRELFIEWAKKQNAVFTGLIIPNVFGPNGKPFYNSVVATFCYQLVNNQMPKIEIDAELKLIYVEELIQEICRVIDQGTNNPELKINYTSCRKVSDILEILKNLYKCYYVEKKEPNLSSAFEKNLFTTLKSFSNK